MSESFNDYYFTLTSFAFSKGCERFEEVMPKSRVKKIIERLKKERGMEWFNLHGCKYIVHYAYDTLKWNLTPDVQLGCILPQKD